MDEVSNPKMPEQLICCSPAEGGIPAMVNIPTVFLI
jgi:hypothetical protein